LVVNQGNTTYEIEQRPELTSGGDLWKTQIPSELRQLRNDLAKNGTKLMLVLTPEGPEVSPLERAHSLIAYGDYNYSVEEKSGRTLDAVYRSTGIPMFSLQNPMERLEESDRRVPLFNTEENHFSRIGSTVAGEMNLSELERWK